LGAAVGAFALAPAAAQAANFEVNSLADTAPDPSPGACTTTPNGCTLREAVNDANANGATDTITFQSGLTGTITLSNLGQLPLTDLNGVTIDGGGVITVSGDTDSSGTPTAGDTRIFNPTTGDATFSNLTLSGGDAGAANGGAILVSSDVVATLDNDTITGNTANAGGGIYSAGELDAVNTEITHNTAAVSGGGISDTGKYSPLHLANTTISNNTAPTGGGIDSSATSGTFQGVSHSDILNTTISGNHADDLGAGMHVGQLNTGDRFVISHSTISGNDAGGGSFGGGIDFSGTMYGDFSVIDSTIAGNSAATGAGVSAGEPSASQVVAADGSLEFANSTIASNTAATAGGGIYLGSYTISPSPNYVSPTLPLDSTIVADNTASGAAQDLKRASNSTAGAFDLSFSLVRAPAGAPVTQTPSGSGILGADPQLSGLANNGGPTETMLIAPTSPAVDKGFAPARLATDQRGQPRTVDVSVPNARDGTDIGAVEIAQGPPTPAPAPPRPKPKCKKHKKKHKRSAESSKKKPKKCKKKKKRR
jgi:CSLREA domain-containing protein